MSLIITTDPDSTLAVEIANVGALAGGGKGGIPVERAAASMRELQDDDGKPLEGAELTAAAKKYAAANGLATKSVKDVDVDALAVENGGFGSSPSIEQLSREAAERDGAFFEADQGVRSTEDLPPQPQEELAHPPKTRH